MSFFEVLYYGDQTIEPFESVQDLIAETKNSEILSEFLHNAFSQLSLEVSYLPCAEKDLFTSVRDFGELARAVQSSGVNHVITLTVLSCVAQLGWTFIYRQRHPEKQSPDANCAVVGICTGSLAAIASAVAQSDLDLLRIAPEFVCLSLRLGTEVSRRSEFLESQSGSWSVVVPKVSYEGLSKDIAEFFDTQKLPLHKAIYISAQSSSGITLSGPPTLLQQFLDFKPALKSSRKVFLPIYGAFHAPHLPLPSLESIVGNSEVWLRKTDSTTTTSIIPSNLTTATKDNQTLGKLLSAAVSDILQKPLHFDNIINALKSGVQHRSIRLSSIGPAHTNVINRATAPIAIERYGSRRLPSSLRTNLHLKSDYRDAIAIVGMACRVPGARSVDELWDLLLEGRDMHRQVPPDRFDVSTHYDPTGKIPNTTITQWGCFDDNVSEFDLSLFKMSPREALQTDPLHRMMLVTGYEALESAGYYDPGGDARPRHGTFYGQAGDDYRQVNSGQNIDTNFITGGIRAFAPGRVSYYFGWEGPSMNIDTACSSSAVAINQACSSLRLRECDMALAGGVNLLTCSDMFAGLSRARFISTTGPCKTLDETADGYCRADGAGSVVLKRYADAMKDKDNILGVIRSIETGHAGTAISITHPEADTQTALFQRILSKVGMNVGDIDHVEMHGTGTQAGDLAETTSIADLLKRNSGRRPADRPLMIASVKPNVGHSEAASGVTSLIKALLMMKHQINPRHIGIKTRYNPKLPRLAEAGMAVPLQNIPYLPTSDKRRVLVNNFNATGGVTGMIVEEHISQNVLAPPRQDIRGHYPIVLSAANNKSLKKALAQLLEYLSSHCDTNIADLSYTLTARRLHHGYAFSCTVNSVEELIFEIQNELPKSATVKRGSSKSIVFVFTGQAVSYVGMAKSLFQTNNVFRDHLTRSDAMCQNMGLPSFLEVIDDDGTDDLEKLGTTKAQLALVALEVALAYLFESWGVRPTTVVGHSLGEYSALCVARALSLADTLYLVGKRAQLMESLCARKEFAMMATSLSPAEAQRKLLDYPQCQISCFNGPNQTVISGPTIEIEAFKFSLETQNIKVKKLVVDYAFHSAQMDAFLEQYKQLADGVSFSHPRKPMVSTYLGDFVRLENLSAQYLCSQTRQPVKFQEAVERISSEESANSLWIELGPAPACSPFINLILDTGDTISALNPNKPNWRTISSMVAKCYLSSGNVRWDEFHKQYLDNLNLLYLPSYPFDMTKHWIQYEGNWIIAKNHGPVEKSSTAKPLAVIKSSTLNLLNQFTEENGIQRMLFSSELPGGYSPKNGVTYKIHNITYSGASVSVDIAMTAASELWSRQGLSAMGTPSVVVTHLSQTQPDADLVKGPQPLKLHISARKLFPDTDAIKIDIVSMGQHISQRTHCVVNFDKNRKAITNAKSTAFLYQSRMDLLEMFHLGTSRLSAIEIQRYSMDSGEELTGLESIQEMVLNPGMFEAVAKVIYHHADGDFVCNPRWVGTLLELSRFVLSYGKPMSYTVASFAVLRMLVNLEHGRIYRCHVRVHATDSTAFSGDIHVFNIEGQPVAEIKGIECLPVMDKDHGPDTTEKEPEFALAFHDLPHAPRLHSRTRVNGVPVDLGLINQDKPEPLFSSEPTPPETPPRPVVSPSQPQPVVASCLTSPSAPLPVPAASRTPFPTTATRNSPPRSSPPLTPKRISSATNSSSRVFRSAEPAHTPPSTKSQTSSSEIDVTRVLSVLAGELGIDLEATGQDALLEDMGVDSIMQMTLVAKIQEVVPADFQIPGQLLVEHNTFAKLKAFFEA